MLSKYSHVRKADGFKPSMEYFFVPTKEDKRRQRVVDKLSMDLHNAVNLLLKELSKNADKNSRTPV